MTGNGKIKVLQCIRQGQIGGGESHLLSLVENLDPSRFQSVVLSFTDGPMIERLNELGIENHVIHTTRPFDISKWKKVKRLISEINPHLVHAHGTRANSNVLWAARSMKLPVIYTVHGWSFHPDQRRITRTGRILGEKYLTSKSDVNISVSASNQQTGKNYISTFQSIVVNNGIDQKKFDPKKEYKNIRAELGIAPEKTLVLFIARFTAHKQPLTLLKAFAKAVRTDPNLHLLMVGDGDQKPEAMDIIKRSGLEASVTLESFRKDVPDVLAGADIFVLPSLWEGLPIGLLEACAMGKAIIASNVDGTSEIIQHGENGILLGTENLCGELSEALIKLASDKELRNRFGSKAIQTITERYNAGHMTRQIESIYLKLTENKIVERNKKVSWSL